MMTITGHKNDYSDALRSDQFSQVVTLTEDHQQIHDFSSFEKKSFSESGISGWRLAIRPPAWRPPTDVYETEELVVVRVEIAGMQEDDFSVELDGRILLIHGTRSDQSERRAFHQMEIHFGEFIIEIEMPTAVSPADVIAGYSNGFLRVLLPKARPHQINIE